MNSSPVIPLVLCKDDRSFPESQEGARHQRPAYASALLYKYMVPRYDDLNTHHSGLFGPGVLF